MIAPRLEIDLDAISDNARRLVDLLAPKGIVVTGVTKGALGCTEIADAMLFGGVVAIGDARVENIDAMRAAGIESRTVLVRSPMLSQIDRVVASCDVSLNTESVVIEALAHAAREQGTTHSVLVMVELGDLREGVPEAELAPVIETALRSEHLTLMGLGTNLACQSGVVPSCENMAALSRIAADVEAAFHVELPTVSGGNSANLEWALSATDTGRINDLRLGESILLGRNPLDGRAMPGLRTDGFVLVAEVIESKEKPSQPWGVIGRSAFGRASSRSGTGCVRQSLLALGRQDVDPDGLIAPPGMRILGASSDHLVLDTGPLRCSVGTEITFEPDYSALLRAMTSPFVAKTFSGGSRTGA